MLRVASVIALHKAILVPDIEKAVCHQCMRVHPVHCFRQWLKSMHDENIELYLCSCSTGDSYVCGLWWLSQNIEAPRDILCHKFVLSHHTSLTE